MKLKCTFRLLNFVSE